MNALALHPFHQQLHARFIELNGQEAVSHYSDPLIEHSWLRESLGVIDLSFRSRICLTGSDRQKFLNGQVTNNIKELKVGEGCYAALVSAKGKMQTDLNIYILEDELLLDLEPGLTETVSRRLEKYIIADDVQVVDVAPHYGLISLQGPKSKKLFNDSELGLEIPEKAMSFAAANHSTLGQLYLMNQPRGAVAGFDLFAPIGALEQLAQTLVEAARKRSGGACGWQALEMLRIEAGIPRFGQDMDSSNFPLESGIDERAVSYTKGCYIGQEIIARIRTYGQVAKTLRGLRLADELKSLPQKGDKLFLKGKEVGYITSAAASPAVGVNIALGYVRREANKIGEQLILRTSEGESTVKIVPLPFTA